MRTLIKYIRENAGFAFKNRLSIQRFNDLTIQHLTVTIRESNESNSRSHFHPLWIERMPQQWVADCSSLQFEILFCHWSRCERLLLATEFAYTKHCSHSNNCTNTWLNDNVEGVRTLKTCHFAICHLNSSSAAFAYTDTISSIPLNTHRSTLFNFK